VRAAHPDDILAVHPDFPAGGDLLADEQADEGRFARAGRADEEDEVPGIDRQVDVAERLGAVRIALADVIERDQWSTPSRGWRIP